MSCLKLYAPHEAELAGEVEYGESLRIDASEPEILSWETYRRSRKLSLIEILARTRALYQNKRCRDCGRPTVQPVEHDDALLGKNRAPIPGSATLLGFHCDYCRTEWPV